MTEQFTEAWFADASEAVVEAVQAGQIFTIPVNLDNRHYAALLTSGLPIRKFKPFALAEADYAATIQEYIDATARAKGYADGYALATYENDPFPLFHNEAVAFKKWRSAVWLKSFELMEEVKSGKLAQPSVEDLLKLLPVIEWPVSEGG